MEKEKANQLRVNAINLINTVIIAIKESDSISTSIKNHKYKVNSDLPRKKADDIVFRSRDGIIAKLLGNFCFIESEFYIFISIFELSFHGHRPRTKQRSV